MTPDPRPSAPPPGFAGRWAALAPASGLGANEALVLALSGGADSVFLLHLLAAARPRPPVTAVHVNHGLRGEESDEDERFCARLCRGLGIPFVSRRVRLEPDGPSLEARAREARYRALVDEARRLRCGTVLTGHHADDGLETLLMRWVRGSALGSLAGPRARLERTDRYGAPVTIVRPLRSLRREEVRRLLADAGLSWREDSSNSDSRFTRNRVRNVLLPKIEAVVGDLDNLHAFGRAVENLESALAGATAYLDWRPLPTATATRCRADARLGGLLARAQLMRLPAALRRRALWRLVLEGTGRAPGGKLLQLILSDLQTGRCRLHALPGGWRLRLRSSEVLLLPPARLFAEARFRSTEWLPFMRVEAPRERSPLRLEVPGSVSLPDGRRITAELVVGPADSPLPCASARVELDAHGLLSPLSVRWPEPGERFRPLGAPGSRPLRRFLADAGVPREERGRVPLVCGRRAGDAPGPGRILWAAGLRPAEDAKVGQSTKIRLRLCVLEAAPETDPVAEPALALGSPADLGRGAAGRDHPRQRALWEDDPSRAPGPRR